MATQDIAVDGWALTLLSPKNVGYAMVCNNIGQSVGAFISFNGLISFTDLAWCNRHRELIDWVSPWGFSGGEPLVTFEAFVRIVGWLFIVSTLMVLLLKAEPPEPRLHAAAPGAASEGSGAGSPAPPDAQEDGVAGALGAIKETARQGISLFSLGSVQLLCLVILTRKLGTAAVDASLSLKLQEYGMPKVDLVTFSSLSLALSLVLPSFIKITKPLDLWLLMFKCKIALDVCAWVFFQYSASYYHLLKLNHLDGVDEPPLSWPFYLSFGAVTIANQIINSLMFTCMGFFFNTVADASIGGTYITLLNAVMNLGHLAPSSFVLYLLPLLTRTVSFVSTPAAHAFLADSSFFDAAATGQYFAHGVELLRLNWAALVGSTGWPAVACGDPAAAMVATPCAAAVTVDGFTLVVFVSSALGVLWYVLLQGTIRELQDRDKTRWTLAKAKQRDM
jgi:MFS transporter, PAT family, solute carrier family 33 (acetyl-CoA transportor), member 1